MKEGSFLVALSQNFAEIELTVYVQHIFSYKKKSKGIILTLFRQEAYLYKTERAAQKAAQAYKGKVERI